MQTILRRIPSRSLLISVFVLAGLLSFQPESLAASYPYKLSKQNELLGLNDNIWASANFGAGITYGVIDTGVTAAWMGFQDRVDTKSAICTIYNCSAASSISDDNGHGTFVASIIAGDARGSGMVGLAPKGTILPIKVLNAQGFGMVSDVAEGIVYAVNHGANVLNLSIDFIPTYSLISAINYAAANNTVIVFAGGNYHQNFLNGSTVSGFTDAAIRHMIFMGSTSSGKKLSSFSDKPGTGGFMSTTGKFYSFGSRWMMAAGQTIWGASTRHNASGYTQFTQMSGTSMTAPQGAGAAGLLAARWPFLLKDGAVADILLATAQDLGQNGTDSKYGTGFLRLDNAFSPVGTLTVPVNNNQTRANNAALVTGGALGTVSGISSAFAKASAYDVYKRDFAMNFSSVIRGKSSSAGAATTVDVRGQTAAATRGFTDLGAGAWLAMSREEISQTDGTVQNLWSMGFQQGDGRYVGVGHGPDAALSFNDARWGGETAFFNSGDSMAGNLLGMTSGASFAAVGMDLNSASRFAFGSVFSEDTGFASLSGQHPEARGAAISYTMRPIKGWALSLSNAFLREDNMLLGSLGSGYLSLGQTSSVSFGVGTSVDLGGGYAFGTDTIAVFTSGSHLQDSLIDSTSRLRSGGLSVVLNKKGATDLSDSFGVSIKKPLRVYQGSAHVNVPTGTDSDGNPVIQSGSISLIPSGNETDFGFNYRHPLGPGVTSGFNLSYRQDAEHVAGVRDAAAMLHLSAEF